jgi:hypothetical protein
LDRRAGRHLPGHLPPVRVGYDIRTPRDVDALLDEVDERIGLDRLRALHVNDSKMPFASRRDRHANVGEGEIGTKMGAFLGCPRAAGAAGRDGDTGPRRPRAGRCRT